MWDLLDDRDFPSTRGAGAKSEEEAADGLEAHSKFSCFPAAPPSPFDVDPFTAVTLRSSPWVLAPGFAQRHPLKALASCSPQPA